jgi:lysophospholipase L1-like esterase
MDWYEPEVHDLEERLSQQSLPPQSTVFYGSSSIRLWTDLATDLGDQRALNVGFGGSTLAACVYFFDRLVVPIRPASLVVYAGDNDLGDGRRPEEVLESFRELSHLVSQSLPGVPFGFVSIKLSPARVALRDFISLTNDLIRQELSSHTNAYYIDVFQAMLDEAGEPRKDLFLEDGLHLSKTGYSVWAQGFEPYRQQIFPAPLPSTSSN